jgi:L-gulonolactone oxidase
MMESHHTSFTISLSKVINFIEDIPKLVQLEPKGLCGIEQCIGTLMHYVTASNAYLGNEENVVEFDLTYYRSKDLMAPRLYEDIF